MKTSNVATWVHQIWENPPDPVVFFFPGMVDVNMRKFETKLLVIASTFFASFVIFFLSYFASFTFVTFRSWLSYQGEGILVFGFCPGSVWNICFFSWFLVHWFWWHSAERCCEWKLSDIFSCRVHICRFLHLWVCSSVHFHCIVWWFWSIPCCSSHSESYGVWNCCIAWKHSLFLCSWDAARNDDSFFLSVLDATKS